MNSDDARFWVLTAMLLKIRVLSDIALCLLVNRDVSEGAVSPYSGSVSALSV